MHISRADLNVLFAKLDKKIDVYIVKQGFIDAAIEMEYTLSSFQAEQLEILLQAYVNLNKD